MLWAQRSFENHHQMFHDRCPENIGPLSKNRTTGSPRHVQKIWDRPQPSPKNVDSPNTVSQKITGAIFCTQFVQCNDGGAGDKCMFLSVFTYSSNPLTQNCEIVQLTKWAHRKFPQHFLPSSRQKKHMANVYFFFLPVNSAAHNTLTASCDCFTWLVSSGEECVHWGSETFYMFLLQQNCTTFLSSNTRAGFHLLRPNGRSDTRE